MKRYTQKALDKTGELAVITLKGVGSTVKDILVVNSKLVLLLFALLWFWDNKVDTSILEGYLGSSRSEFKQGEVAKVFANYRDDTLILHEKGKEPKLITGVKEFEGSQYDDGRIDIDYKNRGFGIEPGVVVTAGDGLRLGVDGEFIYWRRWGILGGVTIPVEGRNFNRLRAHIALGYDLPSKWLSNTSLYGGIDSDKNPTIGIRTKIGGGI